MRTAVYLIAATALAAPASSSVGQGGDAKDLLAGKLSAQFVPTKFSPDKSTIVTQGAAVAMLKDGLLVYSVGVPAPPVSTYKNGKLSQGFGDALKTCMIDGIGRDGGCNSIPQKTLAAGEKVWVSGFGLTKDSLMVQVITEPDDQGRYFANIKFPYKGPVPAPDDAVRTISEVLEMQPAQDQAEAAPDPAPQPAPVQRPRKYVDPTPPLPPPPPPTVSVGMTRDQVTQAFGDPSRKAVVGTKEIFSYSDLKMKITFTNGKVTNID